MIIDTHQHFWEYEPEKHAWLDDNMKKIRRDFLPEELDSVYKKNKIDGCIAVQADQTEEENRFLVNLSEKNDFIKGIIGWVDFRSEDISDRLQQYSRLPKMKGFRHIVQGEPDPNFILGKKFFNGISALEKHDFVYEILVFPYQLGAVLEFVKKFPNQKFVIDHLAKPYIKNGYFDGWAILMQEIAKCENVYCKISGMVTEADYSNWSYEQLQPYMDWVFEHFGAERLMFGSDWPVCLVAAEYEKVKNIAATYVEKLSTAEQDQFWWRSASEFYSL
jgi:L-fuconolactonase